MLWLEDTGTMVTKQTDLKHWGLFFNFTGGIVYWVLHSSFKLLVPIVADQC